MPIPMLMLRPISIRRYLAYTDTYTYTHTRTKWPLYCTIQCYTSCAGRSRTALAHCGCVLQIGLSMLTTKSTSDSIGEYSTAWYSIPLPIAIPEPMVYIPMYLATHVPLCPYNPLYLYASLCTYMFISIYTCIYNYI